MTPTLALSDLPLWVLSRILVLIRRGETVVAILSHGSGYLVPSEPFGNLIKPWSETAW